MTTQLDEQINRTQSESRVILKNIQWETYQKLLIDLSNQSSSRLTYDNGILEIMSPTPKHEILNHKIEQMIIRLSEELNINIAGLGSTTFKSEDLARGFEPDCCFYIQNKAQNEAQIFEKNSIDLTTDPLPDLIVEIDITSSSLNKDSIYAQIGVPELWRHNGKELRFYQLKDGEYLLIDHSIAFPSVDSATLSHFLEQSLTMKSTAFAKMFREWIQQRKRA